METKFYSIFIPFEYKNVIQSGLRSKIATQMVPITKRLIVETKGNTYFFEDSAIPLYLSKKVITIDKTKMFTGGITCVKESDPNVPFDFNVYSIGSEIKVTGKNNTTNEVYTLQDLYKYNISPDFDCYLIVTKDTKLASDSFETFENVNEKIYFTISTTNKMLSDSAIELIQFIRMVLITKNIHIENFKNLYILNDTKRIEVLQKYLKCFKFKEATKIAKMTNEELMENFKRFFVGGSVINSEEKFLKETLVSKNAAVLLKIDGLRTLLIIYDNKEFYALEQNLTILQFGNYEQKIKTPKKVTILDGEFYEGKFYAFDILMLDNKDIRKETLKKRIDTLEKYIPSISGNNDGIITMNTIIFADHDVSKEILDFNDTYMFNIVTEFNSMFNEMYKFVGGFPFDINDAITKFEEYALLTYNEIVNIANSQGNKIEQYKFDITKRISKKVAKGPRKSLFDYNVLSNDFVKNEETFKNTSSMSIFEKEVYNRMVLVNKFLSIANRYFERLEEEYAEFKEGKSDNYKLLMTFAKKFKPNVLNDLVLRYSLTGLLGIFKSREDPFSGPYCDLLDQKYTLYLPNPTFKKSYTDLFVNATLDNDGLIFMDSSDKYPMEYVDPRGYTWYSCQKWKPIEHLTIDLRTDFYANKVQTDTSNRRYIIATLYARNDNKVGTVKLYLNNYNGTYPIAENGDTIIKNSIVEYRYNGESDKYVPVRIRYDKVEPNGIRNVESVKESVNNFIELI